VEEGEKMAKGCPAVILVCCTALHPTHQGKAATKPFDLHDA